MAEEKRRSLGRGLSALLGDHRPVAAVTVTASGDTVTASGDVLAMSPVPPRNGLRSMPVSAMQPGKYQPRRQFEEEAIADLVNSIRDKGVLQPILIRPINDGYEIIAGERRWRAAQRAQLHEVPVIIRDFTDQEALEVALVENLQRQDLSPLEEAEGYKRLIEEFSHTQEELAKAVGKSRSHVANMMRLLALPDSVKYMVEARELSAGHARALLTTDDPVALAREIKERGLNVRQTEQLAGEGKKNASGKNGASSKKVDTRDADIIALERDLSQSLGLRVDLKTSGKGGQLILSYSSLEQLDDLLSRLGRS